MTSSGILLTDRTARPSTPVIASGAGFVFAALLGACSPQSSPTTPATPVGANTAPVDANVAAGPQPAATPNGASTTRPALTVTVSPARRESWSRRLNANGSVAAWQEASVGAEVGGLRLTDVLVNVGDRVRRGQPLARLAQETVQAEVAQQRAALAEAEAAFAEAKANAGRARQLERTGAISAQQIAQAVTAEQTARARVDASRARMRAEQVRLSQTRVLAPDDGVISQRTATVGAVTQPGQELFRLIRQGRLEWRAEVTADELAAIRSGQPVTVVAAGGTTVQGKVRMIAPTVDAATRQALVYVDLAAAEGVRAGMFARGEFTLGTADATTVPASAVMRREGFDIVYLLEGDRARAVKVEVGRRQEERVEIVRGLDADAKVIDSGVPFLADGDRVRVGTPTEATATR